MMFGLITDTSNSNTISAYDLRSIEAPKLAIPTESGTGLSSEII